MTVLIDVYYQGSFGDLANADWFYSNNFAQIKDVVGVGSVAIGPGGLVTLKIDTQHATLDCRVRRAPNTRKYVGIDKQKVLYEIKMECHDDIARSQKVYRLDAIPHEDDGYGNRTPDMAKMHTVQRVIDDQDLMRVKDPVRLVRDTVLHMGSTMGVHLVDQIPSPMPSHVSTQPYAFEKDFAPNEWIREGIEPLEEDRTEGDDLMDFFKSRND